MKGLRRQKDTQGLAENRRTLIHRYMVDLDEPPEPKLEAQPSRQPQEPIDLIEPAVSEPEAPTSPAPALGLVQVEPGVLHPVPPAAAPERREGGEVSVDVFRQTLEHVVRLSEQVAEARDGCSRGRERLAAGS